MFTSFEPITENTVKSIHLLKKRGRKSCIISEQLSQDIIGLKLDLNLGSSGIAAYLHSVPGIKIESSSVHRVLLEEVFTEKDLSNSVRRRPWVRYEREHSLSAIHMDWYLCSDSVTWVCAVLNDAYRRNMLILFIGLL